MLFRSCITSYTAQLFHLYPRDKYAKTEEFEQMCNYYIKEFSKRCSLELNDGNFFIDKQTYIQLKESMKKTFNHFNKMKYHSFHLGKVVKLKNNEKHADKYLYIH